MVWYRIGVVLFLETYLPYLGTYLVKRQSFLSFHLDNEYNYPG